MTDLVIHKLVNRIRKYNKAYRLGKPIVTDAEYDMEVDKLKRLDPDNAWFKQIEPAPVAENRKVKLPIPMKSLYKVKSLRELNKWLNSFAFPDSTTLVITPKFDGLSLLHNEQTGMTYSRGGAENEGQDCTKHYEMAQCKSAETNLMYTYGEFVFTTSAWKECFEGKKSPYTGDKYKSPRNTAAGLLNRDEPSELLQEIDFFRYGADLASMHQFETYKEFYKYVCEKFHQKPLFCEVMISDLSTNMLHDLYDQWSKLYYIDGLVIYFNDISMWDKLGRQETTGNPNYAIAYKHPDFTETFETVVEDVQWSISKTGALKPVAHIDAVDAGDCEIDSPTAYHAKYVKANGIGKGAVIRITRSGGVIPKIIEVIKPASQEEMGRMFDELSVCPYCGAPTAWNDTQVELGCTNADCPGVKFAEIVFFYSTVGAERIGEGVLRKIFDAGFTSLRQILDITFEELIDIEGFGDEIANIVLANNAQIKAGVEVTKLMHASNCFWSIGEVTAKKLLLKMSESNRHAFVYGMLDIPEDDLEQKPWFINSKKTEQAFYRGVNDFYKFIAENSLVVLPMEEQAAPTSDKYNGFNVCFTGIRDKMLEEDIKLGGGCIANGVTKKTTHLIVADHDSASTKAKKAQGLNIPIMTIEEFKAL